MSTALAGEAAPSTGLKSYAERLASVPGFTEVLRSLAEGHGGTLDGVWGSSRALAVAALLPHCPGTLVVVTPRSDDLAELGEDITLFSDAAAEIFPPQEPREEGEAFDETYVARLRVLKSLLAPRPVRLVLCSVQSLLQSLPRPGEVASSTRILRIGETLDRDSLVKWLSERGFASTPAVELPGEYSVRGGIVDVFSPDAFQPCRIELFGDEIVSLRRFDAVAQRSMESLSAVEITWGPRGSAQAGHLSDYLVAGSWYVLIEPTALREEAQYFLRTLAEHSAALSCEQLWEGIHRFPSVTVSALAVDSLEATCRLPFESIERFSGDLARVRSEIDAVCQGEHVYIVCQNEAEQRRLREVFSGTALSSENRLHFPLGHLREGFRILPEKALLIGGGELFHRGDVGRLPRRHLCRAIDSFLDLRKGDLVVHVGHGIARYHGLRLLERDGHAEEHLELEFAGGTRLFVPAARIDLVQKYVGGSKARPVLARIGGRLWSRQKLAAAMAVEDLAAEMLELQAKRAAQPGIRFPEDSAWQRAFDASFPYRETADQLDAMAAIKSDMCRDRPMDRLLCGDVGFGKTELAIRAAFKAVDSGYQVAVLVPTTVLAEQHRRTFSNRMAEYPFTIAALSRFCSRAEELRVLEGLAEGTIDIVIGTHRLVQPDVTIKNLGLIIIDEEQRFGVAVKERLKAYRHTVDVLTMTATPIPRTLHMSLLGLRDISNLETPPEERVPVETRVARWDDDLIRHALLRELNRGGQIFFVHNRVQDIHHVEEKIRRILPDARMEIGHGQMAEHDLERVMLRFVEHKFDILLATTIIESGLDIPNANTIFINEADRYGLADLHQLRGRVGRYKHRAYCYLLVEEHKSVTGAAARRLRAIEEYSNLGAGFSIAMRDLEIRGAGNILGTQQSGHIALVGYELYCQLLEQAVRRLEHRPPMARFDVEIDLPGSVFLPRSYIPDVRHKIELYRRLARVDERSQLEDIRAELEDRFGPAPLEVSRLLARAELRLMAVRWRVRTIRLEDDFIVFHYVDPSLIRQLSQLHSKKLRIVDEQSAYYPLPRPIPQGDALSTLVRSILSAGDGYG